MENREASKRSPWRIILLIATGLALALFLTVLLWPTDSNPGPSPDAEMPTPPNTANAVIRVGNYPVGLPEPEAPEKPDLPRRRGVESSFIRAVDDSGDEVSKEYCFDATSCLSARYEIEVGKTVYITAVMWTDDPADGEGRLAGVAVQYPDGTTEQTVASVDGDSRPVTVSFPFDTSEFIPEFLQEQDGEVISARYVVWAWLYDEGQVSQDKWRKLEFVALAPPDPSTGGDYRAWNEPDPTTTLESWATLGR